MEILVGLVLLVVLVGFVVKFARENARREREALTTLRDVIEERKAHSDGGGDA